MGGRISLLPPDSCSQRTHVLFWEWKIIRTIVNNLNKDFCNVHPFRCSVNLFYWGQIINFWENVYYRYCFKYFKQPTPEFWTWSKIIRPDQCVRFLQSASCISPRPLYKVSTRWYPPTNDPTILTIVPIHYHPCHHFHHLSRSEFQPRPGPAKPVLVATCYPIPLTTR